MPSHNLQASKAVDGTPHRPDVRALRHHHRTGSEGWFEEVGAAAPGLLTLSFPDTSSMPGAMPDGGEESFQVSHYVDSVSIADA
jgi:hypothetical protein